VLIKIGETAYIMGIIAILSMIAMGKLMVEWMRGKDD
jgi:hypothetical protein